MPFTPIKSFKIFDDQMQATRSALSLLNKNLGIEITVDNKNAFRLIFGTHQRITGNDAHALEMIITGLALHFGEVEPDSQDAKIKP